LVGNSLGTTPTALLFSGGVSVGALGTGWSWVKLECSSLFSSSSSISGCQLVIPASYREEEKRVDLSRKNDRIIRKKSRHTLSVDLWVLPETILHSLELLYAIHSLGLGFRVHET